MSALGGKRTLAVEREVHSYVLHPLRQNLGIDVEGGYLPFCFTNIATSAHHGGDSLTTHWYPATPQARRCDGRIALAPCMVDYP
jgi:hypothetical protein